VVVDGQGELFQIIPTLGLATGLACRLNCRQQEGNKNADDGDNHQQLDEGKSPNGATPCCGLEHDSPLQSDPGTRASQYTAEVRQGE
jgi:hypothetical protein